MGSYINAVVGYYEGHRIDPQDIEVPVRPSADHMFTDGEWVIDLEKQKKRVTDIVQRHMDEKAQSYGYDNILSATTYVTSTNAKFQQEGVAFRDWRDAVWTYCYTVLENIVAGTNTIETEEELIESLPPFTLGA